MIYSKIADITKYRPSGSDLFTWPLKRLMHFHDLLVKDSNEGNLDPYLMKVMANPPKK